MRTKVVEATEVQDMEILKSPAAMITGICQHPTKPHHYILAFFDAKQMPIAHRVLSAAEVLHHVSNTLNLVSLISSDYIHGLILLGNAEGMKN